MAYFGSLFKIFFFSGTLKEPYLLKAVKFELSQAYKQWTDFKTIKHQKEEEKENNKQYFHLEEIALICIVLN